MALEFVMFVVGGYLGALVMQRFSKDFPELPGPVHLAVRVREFFTLSSDEWKVRYSTRRTRQ